MAKKGKFFNDDLNLNDNSNYEFEEHVNKKDDHSDKIYLKENKKEAEMYDRNDPIVKVILTILGSIAVIGTIYYIIILLK